jgi:lipopolysaccharide export system protein LptA
MKRTEAARLARISAIVAVCLAGITSGIYLHRKWVAHVEKRNAPAAPPRDVERQSSGLTFSKGEGTRVVYTVHASKSTDFRGQDASLLEEVVVTVFGKNGDRNDVLRTQSCRYAKADGSIQCNGDVLMDLQSAADAARSQKQLGAPIGVTVVETSAVTFEHATGVAQTVQSVKFRFPNGRGKAIGAVYSSDDGHLRLVRNVELILNAAAAQKVTKNGAKPPENDVVIDGSSLEFAKESRVIVLNGPVTANTATQALKAGELTVEMDQTFKVQSLIATPGPTQKIPEVTSRTARGNSVLRAEKLTSVFSPEGWTTAIRAEGKVQGSSADGSLSAETGVMEMWPRVNEAKLLTLRGNVVVESHDPKAGTSRTLKTNAVQLNFALGEAGRPSRITHGETLEHGTLDWKDAAGARSKVDAAKLAADFAATGKPQQTFATGGVQTERESEGKPTQRASAATGVVQMAATGEWSKINLRGNVRVKEGDRNAESEEAVMQHDPQTATLSGKAVVRDASSETHASRITLTQASGDILAEGTVRSTDFSSKDGTVQFAAVPANISANRLEANSKTGRALYSGHARLWQGSSVLEADSIELLRATRILNAKGNVKSVFQQAPSSGALPTVGIMKPAADDKKQPSLWHVSSKTLTYWDAENKARLEKNVLVQSTDQKITSATMDLYFTRQAAAGSNPAIQGASQISRAVGNGGVVIEEGDRRATADTGVYTAQDQKFVLSGGDPTLYDAAEGTTKGRELTFYIADDTIVVDSGNGLRTLTRHRVQR